MSDLFENWARLNQQIKTDQNKICLVAVSKYASVDAIKALYALGARDFGESKVQEALEKMDLLPKDINWHFIGRIQSNKINKIIGRFSLIHSIADVKTACEISKKCEEKKIIQDVLLQVNLSKENTKQGFSEDELISTLPLILSLKGIRIKGLMTMGPMKENEEMIKACFLRLKALRDELKSKYPFVEFLSMGMSGDYQLAIASGATHLRIGSLLFS